MSDILIRNVAMPHNCHECDALGISDIVGLVCNDKNEGYSFKKRPDACPLVEMSPEFPIEELRLQVVYLAGMMAAEEQKWVPVSEDLPKDEEIKLVTCKTKKGILNVNRAYYMDGHWHGSGSMSNVIAWMELPKPYHPEEGQK